MERKIPLEEGNEELKILFEVADVLAAEQRRIGRALTRWEKGDLSGRATENIIRNHLRDRKLNMSRSRVFIDQRGILDKEIDLLLLEPEVNAEKPRYEAEEVKAVLEIKYTAATDQTTRTRANFDLISKYVNDVRFAYVCLSERTTYTYRVVEKGMNGLGYPVFELISRVKSRGPWIESHEGIMSECKRITRDGELAMWSTGRWADLIEYLHQ